MISKPEFIEESKTLEYPQMLGKEARTMETFMSKLELVHLVSWKRGSDTIHNTTVNAKYFF